MLPIGDQVRLARQAHGLSQKELAAKAGIYRQTITKIELGKSKNPYHGTLEKIRKALELSSIADLQRF